MRETERKRERRWTMFDGNYEEAGWSRVCLVVTVVYRSSVTTGGGRCERREAKGV